MIKALIFDFDGVIVESVDIKTEAFRELFKDHPEQLEALIEYHLHHGGVSRVEKIRYFYRELLRQPLSQDDLNALCERFSDLVVEKVIAASFVQGAQELLQWAKGKFDMHIVSGTPQEEIREVIGQRKLGSYFTEVFGSPRTKKDIVAEIISRHHYDPDKVVLIGDAITDLEAAKAHGLAFLARETETSGDWINNEYITGRFPDLQGVKQWIVKKANS